MRRSAGAILRDRRPATIIKSDCRGLPRNTSAPKRAMSYREQLIAIISIAQHARPNVTGQIDDRRAHCTIFSTVVVSTGISLSKPISAISYQLSAISYQLSAISYQLSAISYQFSGFSLVTAES